MQITKEETDELLKKLEEIRLHRGKTKVEFAEKFDVSPTSYSNWINKRKKPSDLNAYQIKRFVDRNYNLVVSDKVEQSFQKSDEITLHYPVPFEVELTFSEKEARVWDNLEDEKLKKIGEKAKDAYEKEVHDQLKKYREKEKVES